MRKEKYDKRRLLEGLDRQTPSSELTTVQSYFGARNSLKNDLDVCISVLQINFSRLTEKMSSFLIQFESAPNDRFRWIYDMPYYSQFFKYIAQFEAAYVAELLLNDMIDWKNVAKLLLNDMIDWKNAVEHDLLIDICLRKKEVSYLKKTLPRLSEIELNRSDVGKLQQ
jgi:hypothetical protein